MRMLREIVRETQPALEELEPLRRLYLRRRVIHLAILLVPLAGLLAGALLGGGKIGFSIGAGIWLIVGLVLYQVRAGALASRYRRDYKTALVPRLLHSIDPGLSFDPGSGIPVETFTASELYTKRPDRYRSEDLLHGRYGKTFLQLAEVHAEDRQTTTDSKGRTRTRYVTIFKGLFLVADFHKHFSGRTFVFPDNAERLLGRFGRHLQRWTERPETDLVHLEDPEFEELFCVYSTDQIECRYILSTSMMERLKEMRLRFDSEVRIGFKESSIVLAVRHRDPFLEPDTGKPATDEAQIEALLGQLRFFLDTIEELDLNTRIWTKR